MSKTIKGITIEIDGKTQGLEKALKTVNSSSISLNKELKQINRLLKFDPKNTELLAQKQEVLSQQISTTENKLKGLKDAQAQVNQQFKDGKISQEQYRAFNREIQSTESSLKGYKTQLEATVRKQSEFAEKSTTLKNSQRELVSQSERLTKEYQLQRAELGNNASESDKAKLRQEYLAKAMANSKDQVANLEQQLALSKKEFGENSTQVDKLEKELLEAKKASAEFANEYAKATDKVSQFSQKAKSVGGKVTDIGKKASVAITAPIAAGFGYATKKAADFDGQLQTIKALLNDGDVSQSTLSKQIDELKSKSMEWSAQYGISTESINTGMEEIIKKGYSFEQTVGAMPSILDASVASGDDFNVVMSASTSILEQFGLKADNTKDTLVNTQRVTDSLTFVANKTAAGFEDMATAMEYVGPVSHALGISLEEASSAIGLMSNNGIDGEKAGTALRGALSKLMKPSKQNAEGFNQLGISVEDFKNGALSLPDMLDKIKNNTKGWTNEQKASAIALAFGVEAQSGMNVLIDQGGDALRDLTKETENAKGYTKKLADQMNNTDKKKIEKFKESLANLATVFGEKILPVLTPVIEKLTELMKSFSALPDGVQQAILVIGAIAAILGPILIIIGQIATGIGAIVGFFAEDGAFFKIVEGVGKFLPLLGKLVGVLFSWPVLIGVLLAAIAFLIYKYWDEIKAFFAGLGQWFHEFWEGLSQYFSETWENISKSSSEIWEGMTNSIQSVWNGIKTWFSETWDNISKGAQEGWKNITEGISTIWQSFTKKISDTLTNIGQWFSGKWQSIKEGAVNGWNSLVEAVSPIIEFLGKVIMVPISFVQASLEFIWGWIKVGAILAWEGIKKAAEVAWNFIKDTIIVPIQGAYDWLIGKFTELGLWLSEKWTEFTILATTFWESIKQAILTPIGAAYDWVVTKFSELGAWLGEKWNEILQVASNLWQGVKDNIFQPMSDAKDGVVNKASEIWSGLSDWFGRTQEATGEKWQGIKETMSDKFTSAKEGIAETASNIWSSISETFGRVVSTVAEKFESVKEFIMGPIRTARDFVGQMIDEILGFFSRIKLPHFSVNFEDKKIFGKSVSVPKFNVDWYAKGGILTKPTIFGANGNALMGGGEAGKEAVAPLSDLLGYVKQAVREETSGQVGHDEIHIHLNAYGDLPKSVMQRMAEDLAYSLNDVQQRKNAFGGDRL